MNPGLVFLIGWLASCAGIFGIVATVFNYDRVMVFVLRMVNAPVYEEARRVAALIYQHPEQWKAGSYDMEHPKLGRIGGISSVGRVEVEGPFGHWEPSCIERRIIYDAMQWYRSTYMKRRLVNAMESG